MNELTWSNIYYHEELDTDGSLLYVEWAEEAEYRQGYLVRCMYEEESPDSPKIRNESITFIP